MLNQLKSIYDKPPRELIGRLKMRMVGGKRLSTFSVNTPCFFVLSTGRTGTTTLAELLNLAPEVKVYHEAHPNLLPLRKLAYLLDDSFYPLLKDVLQACRTDLINESLSSGVGYGETGPHCTFLAPMYAMMLPNCKFVHLIRDPRYVIRSGMRRKWYEGHINDVWRIEPKSGTKEAEQWHDWTAFEKCAWLWAETNRRIRTFCDTIGSQRYCLIHSEAIFNEDNRAISHLFQFLGLTKPGQKKIKHVIGKQLNRQNRGQFIYPAEWNEELESKMCRIVGEEMQYYINDESRFSTNAL